MAIQKPSNYRTSELRSGNVSPAHTYSLSQLDLNVNIDATVPFLVMRCAIDPPEDSAETQDNQEVEREIAELERRLAAAKLRLRRRETSPQAVPSPSSSIPQCQFDIPIPSRS